ncbi:hypothetical protein N7456_007455 [Penicillium angulare]|uniref:Uncharacterized protein n=1 Tax=Penicillium angulare TaxID=116970 RepID=A0A9W9K870_9EURO|nr:hypothetical protein N7456_007455 [Penicillium angulare]
MYELQQISATTLSLPEDNYIYSIAPCAPGALAAISSDDSLRIFDVNLDLGTSVISPKSHNEGVTCLRSYSTSDSQLVTTGGRDGKAKLWDIRAGSMVLEIETNKNFPVLSVACNPHTNTIVTGTELVSSQAVVALWDIRSANAPRLQYVESHNDDITELQYHPTQHNILLSGSTDGLVNVYDTTITDEDDALVQVINHGSVHHAGFLSNSAIYALSHDEHFSVHPVTNPDSTEQEPEPEPVEFNDLREPLACEYVVQLCMGAQVPFIAAGNKIDKRLDLVPLISGPNWQFDQENLWRLPGAHGEEVVRSVYLDDKTQSVFTCGEDGYVRAWKPNGGENQAQTGFKSSRPKERKQKDRFRPY